MNPEFWQKKWQKDEIGFHQEKYNPHLQNYSHLFKNQKHIFVPLCGKSKDLLWLMEQGHHVIGVELSQKAVELFFNENSLPFQLEEKKQLKIYRGDTCTIYCGDFFHLTKEDLNDCSAVYDRAALIALPKDLRKKYTQHLFNIISKPQVLLITIQYDQEKVDGPPFSVPSQEVEVLFANENIQLLQEHITEKIPKKMKELNLQITQSVFLINR